jgi:tetratricopeptide (TPR) repeat protein
MQTQNLIQEVMAGGLATSPLDLKTLRAQAVDFQRAGNLQDAITLYRQFLALVPTDASIWSNLGVAHRILHEYDAAVGCYQRALELKPDDAGFLSNLGNALKDLDRMDEAVTAHARAAALSPDDYNTRHNYGIALRDAGRFDDSLREFAAAFRIDPNNANPRWDSAVSHLYKGDFANGWADYEWRWKIGEVQKRPSRVPEWRGEACAGKTIYFYPEQGFGDTLLAVRFLPWVKAQGARVYLECKPPLRRLFASLIGVDALCDPERPPPADTDLIAPLMALPGLYGANLDNLPPVPVLNIPPAAQKRAERLMGLPLGGSQGGRFRVGVVWSGSVTFKRNHKRSVGVDRFIPLSHIPGVQLYSLQKGPREGDFHTEGAASVMIDIGSKVEDFAETAACIQNLDLVIMTDSSVAHLCGSLGKPVWNLLNHAAYWLYLTRRDDTPWYSSMRLYRQPAAGDWDSVFRRVQTDLASLVAQSRKGMPRIVH